MSFKPSPQQQHFFDWVATGKGSARLDSVAGSGKTTTITKGCEFTTGTVAMVAYNKKIGDELKARLEAMGLGQRVKAGTFHSFGLAMWKAVAPKALINADKVRNLCDIEQVPDEYRQFVIKAVSLAKQRAIGVLCPFSDAVAWTDLVNHFELEETLKAGSTPVDTDTMITTAISYAQRILRISTDQCISVIDFDDMIYAPLVHDVKGRQYDWVFVDEAQDTNPARRALAKKMLKPGGRFVGVGDRHQAIYGFTGADNDAFDLLASEFGCVDMPLTVSYRCPKAVVALAQTFVSHIQAADTASEGAVSNMSETMFKKLDAVMLNGDTAVLCRNTKPLVQLAYHFIRNNIPAHVEGRDIGKGLLALMNKWKVQTVTALMDKLEDYLARETERFLAKGQEAKAAALADKVETLAVIADALPDGADLNMMRQHINQLFEDTPDGQRSRTLTLSTVHKSKGREWETVILYGRNKFMPSPYARQDWQLDQETNLMYVAVTRAKNHLIEVAAV